MSAYIPIYKSHLSFTSCYHALLPFCSEDVPDLGM